jgi:UDP-N-acetylmuramoylalanine--D-glutamate ligase
VKGNLLTFGLGWNGLNLSGTYVKDGWIYFQGDSGGVEKILPLGEIQLRGQHNLFNVLAACTIARAAEIPIESIRAGVAAFKGVAHRLEHVRSWKEVDWYNDSIATAPERSMAAIRSFDEPIVLLAGGRDKDLPWDEFASLVTRRVRALILFGEAAGKIERAIKTVPGENETILIRCSGLKDAIQAAAEVARSGDVVLLSPGGTSFDEFKDFEERGECFRKWVMEL